MTSPPQCTHWGASPFRGGFFCPQLSLPPLKGEGDREAVERSSPPLTGEIVSRTLPARGNGDREAVER